MKSLLTKMAIGRRWLGAFFFSHLLCFALGQQEATNCHCALFKYNEFWAPKELLFSIGTNRHINCSDASLASSYCNKWCEGEMIAMRALVSKDASLLQNHQPNTQIQCPSEHVDTVAFTRVCQSDVYNAASSYFGPSVCCDQNTHKPLWCVKIENDMEFDTSLLENHLQARKLDLQKDQNDIFINEIEDSVRPEKIDIKKTPSKTDSSVSWIKTAMKFFGYSSFGDLIRNIDIFALPSKIKGAVRTYKDELSMGRCYMEFTTFKIFTKQESPFDGLLRKKRESPLEQDGLIEESDAESDSRDLDPMKKEARKRAITNFMDNLAKFMDGSETTRQYAGLLKTFLPVVSQMYTGDSSSVMPTLLNLVGPLLKQMNYRRPPQRPADRISQAETAAPIVNNPKPQLQSQQASSPLASMAINVFGNLLRSYLAPPQRQVNKASELTDAQNAALHQPTRPQGPSFGDLSSSGMGSIANMLLQSLIGGSGPARPKPAPVPQFVARPPKPEVTKPPEIHEKQQEKSFINMILEVIRPIFISIMGATPGDSGVKEIRRVSTLSTLGRVDDTLREEVDSPLFCFKKYAVNKAWSITETGIRTVVDTFSQAEQESMRRMLRN